MRDSFAFAFVPVKDRQGDFNVDVKGVTTEIRLTLPVPPPKHEAEEHNSTETEERHRFVIEDLDVDIRWKDVVVKFDRIAGRFSTIADLFLNQVQWKSREMQMFFCENKSQFLPLVGHERGDRGGAEVSLSARGPSLLRGAAQLLHKQPALPGGGHAMHDPVVGDAGVDMAMGVPAVRSGVSLYKIFK